MSFAFGRPSCGRALRCAWAPNLRTCGRALRLCCRRALGRPTCGRALHCVGSPNLRTCLAFCWGTQLADLPCVVFGRPSCLRALRCVGPPNLGEAVLKTLPPSQNWFLSVLRLVFLPSAPFVWSFSSQLFVRFVTAIRVFRYGSSCIWAPILRTHLALHSGARTQRKVSSQDGLPNAM